jgi:hypothetical protein
MIPRARGIREMRSPMPEIRRRETRESPTRIPNIAEKPARGPPRIANRSRRKVSAPGERIITKDDRTKGKRTLVSTTAILSLAGTV